MIADPQYKILAVDDTHTNLRLLSTALKTRGYAVVLADSGEKALQLVESEKPDLILLDIRMPGMDGLQVCEKLKADSEARDVPIIFLTALDDKKTLLRGLNMGAIDYVTKPFDVMELLSRVQNHLHSKRKQDELKSACLRDSLTELHNRKFMDERLEQEISLAVRGDGVFSVAMLDIDHFKQINDQYGHQVGDEVLIMLANELKRVLRKEDILCRYGGEEFFVILPATDQADALLVAEKLRQTIESITWRHEGLHTTLSGGVSTYTDKEMTGHDMISRADSLLYKAKRQGRNQIQAGDLQ